MSQSVEPQSTFDVIARVPWEIVISYTNDPYTYNNLMNVSNDLRELMESKRCTRLFPPILKNLVPYLEEAEMNNLRLVCRTWKKTVDDLYESSPYQYEFAKPKLAETVNNEDDSKHCGTYISTVNQIQRILNSQLSRPNCDLVGKRLTIKCEDVNVPIFWRALKDFLVKFGRSVWYLHIFYKDIESTHSCLMAMPNLVSLNFESTENADYDMGLASMHLVPNPFPHLVNLKVLSAEQDIPDIVVESLYNIHATQLRHLQLDSFRTLANPVCNHLANLAVLCCDLTMIGLEMLARESPPIVNLQSIIIPDITNSSTRVSGRRVFTCLESFRETLRFLVLGITTTDYEAAVHSNLNLMKLKKALLCSYSGPLDPFLSCTNLERLALIGHCELSSWNDDSKVHFYFESGKLISNIWKFMPQLRKLTLPTEALSVREEKLI